MDITISKEQAAVPVTVIHLNGSLDGATYQEFQTKADEVIKSGAKNLLIDLTHVPYMSSAGLRVLNSLFNALRSNTPGESEEAMEKGITAGTFKSPHLKLLNPSRRVLEALQTAGFDMFLEIHHDLNHALASFANGA
jgi:anti-anti-sigma factor